jgi:hypothetical protein
MKKYLVSNKVTGNVWDGKGFNRKAFDTRSGELLVDAPTLAVIRATYLNVVAVEIDVVTPEEQEAIDAASVAMLNSLI